MISAQFRNASEPMLVTLAGMVSVPVIPVSSNAATPMSNEPEAGRTSAVMLVQPPNAFVPILLTLAGIVNVPVIPVR